MASSWLEEDTLCPEGQYLLENKPIVNVGGAGEGEGEGADAGKDDDDGRDHDQGSGDEDDACPDDADGDGMAVGKLGQHSQSHALPAPPQQQEQPGVRAQPQQVQPPGQMQPQLPHARIHIEPTQTAPPDQHALPHMAPQQHQNQVHALKAPINGGHTQNALQHNQQLPVQPPDAQHESSTDANFYGESDDDLPYADEGDSSVVSPCIFDSTMPF